MLGGTRRGRAARAATAVALSVLAVAGCASSQADERPAVPTFPRATSTSAAAAPGAADQGVVPDDCARVLTVSDLGALLGLPLDTVAVRSTRGVPAPSVGRTERLDCAYTSTAGGPLLGLNAAAYTDDAAAKDHWRLNAAAEDGTRRDLPIGTASAVLIEQGGGTVLTVLYGSGTLTFTLPRRPLPGNRAPGDMLVDLALRVLPSIGGAAPKPTPTPSRPPRPAQAAGAP